MLRTPMRGALDTLQTVKRVGEAGFNDAQAEAMTEVLRKSRRGTIADLAPKADIAEVEAGIAAVRSEMALMRWDLKAKIEAVRQELEAKIEILRRDVTIRLGSMLVMMTGILLAAKFFG